MATPQLTPDQVRPPASSSEEQYKSMIDFHKWIVTRTLGALALIVAAGGWVFYSKMDDVNSAAQKSINRVEVEAHSHITQVEEDTKKEIEKRVEAGFEQNNVQQLITKTAETRVNAAVDKAISNNLQARIEAFTSEAKQLREDIAETGEIANAGSRLREGWRSALDTLKAKAKSSNPRTAQYAQSTLTLILGDWEKSLRRQVTESGLPAREATQLRGVMAPKGLSGTMKLIRETDDVGVLGTAMMVFNEQSGTNISMFDVPAAERWCAEHRPQCD